MKRSRRKGSGLRRYWILYIPLLIAVIAGLFYAASWPGFRPRKIVISGNRTVPASVIAAKAAIRTDKNLWLQNAGAAANRVSSIPNIDRVNIQRSFPANVRIVVTERTPYALLRSGAQAAVIDETLRVLQAGAVALLPQFDAVIKERIRPGVFLKDRDLRTLAEDYARLHAQGLAIERMQVDRYGDLIATMRGGVRLLLGDQNRIAEKIALIRPILSQNENGGRRIAAVDLRALGTPVVVYR